MNGSTVYVGGLFTTIGKAGTARNHLVAINTEGTLSTWNPNPEGLSIFDLAVSGSAFPGGTVYAAGEFSSIGGIARNQLATISTSGTIGTWNPNPNGDVYALSVVSGTVYVGGDFTMIGSELQSGFARLKK